MARRIGDAATLFTVLHHTRATPAETGSARDRLARSSEAIDLAVALGRIAKGASLLAWQVATRIELGDADGASRDLDMMESLLEPYHQPHYRWRVPLVRAMLADLEGRFADADAHSRRAFELAEGHPPAVQLFLTQRMGWLNTRGDDEGWAEFEPMLARAIEGGPLARLYRSIVDVYSGRFEDVRDAFELLHRVPLRTLPDGGGLAWACAEAGLREHAAMFYAYVQREERERGAWQFGPGRVTSMGPRAFVLGRLAVLLGREDDALADFARARDLVVTLRSRPFIAQIDLAWAELLVHRDRDGARARAEDARLLAGELGMRRIENRARALVERLTTRGHVSTPAIDESTAPDPAQALTLDREGELWRVAARGRQVLLRDAKGLGYLDALVRAPCREIHVLALVGARDEGDAGPMLDARAKAQYRERAMSLRDELAEHERNGDLGNAERARTELKALAGELARPDRARAALLGGDERRCDRRGARRARGHRADATAPREAAARGAARGDRRRAGAHEHAGAARRLGTRDPRASRELRRRAVGLTVACRTASATTRRRPPTTGSSRPDDRHTVDLELLVRRDQHEFLVSALRNQHAIERVAMVRSQLRDALGVSHPHGQLDEAVAYERLRGRWYPMQLSQGGLDRDLPARDCAHVHLDGVDDLRASFFAQARTVRLPPNERVGVQQQSHGVLGSECPSP